MKVLVTGADGFIGSHLVEELVRRDAEVTALSHYNSFNSNGWLDSLALSVRSKITVMSGDIRDHAFVENAVAGHDTVAHLAALIGIPYSYSAPASYLETNAFGTLNVMEACRSHGIQRVVHTSTSEVYGSARYVPIDEGHPLVGQSPYSASKIAADQIAFSYWSSFSLPVVTLRPFNAYGPRQSQRAFIPSVLVQILAGESSLKLGSLAPTRDLTFVTDTVRGFATVLESDQGLGETFNLGSSFEVSMAEVVEVALDVSGADLEVVLDVDRVRPENSEVDRLFSDSKKIRDVFGWEPRFSGVEGLSRGIEATYDWLSSNWAAGGYEPTKYVL